MILLRLDSCMYLGILCDEMGSAPKAVLLRTNLWRKSRGKSLRDRVTEWTAPPLSQNAIFTNDQQTNSSDSDCGFGRHFLENEGCHFKEYD